jgi:hypothetical protein
MTLPNNTGLRPALAVWRSFAGLPPAWSMRGPGPRLQIAGGHDVHVRYRDALDAPTARRLADELDRTTGPAVVVTRRATVPARTVLHDRGVGLVDGSGLVRVSLPGLTLYVDAPRAPAGSPLARDRSVRLGGRTGLVAQALLLRAEAGWHVRELADRCGLSPSPVHFALRHLEEQGVVVASGRGPAKTRHVVDRAALLDLVADEHHDRGVEEVRGHVAGAPDLEALARTLDGAGVPYAATTAAAFARLTRAPAPADAPATVWVGGDVPLAALLAPAPDGPPVVLRRAPSGTPLAFARNADGVRVVNLVRLHLDLADAGDPRRAAVIRRALVGT